MMLLTVCGVSCVARAMSARDKAPLSRNASNTTRRLWALAPPRLVPAVARMARFICTAGNSIDRVEILPETY